MEFKIYRENLDKEKSNGKPSIAESAMPVRSVFGGYVTYLLK